MADAPIETWITGIGIVSCLGEGADAHWQALVERHGNVDARSFAPYFVHPLSALDLDKQIPKDIAWVMRVDGHTDKRPITNSRFKSNWELSAARAIACPPASGRALRSSRCP